MDTTMPDREQPQSLWAIWWNAILPLPPSFPRLRTFMCFVPAVAGLTVRVDLLGVTSIVRALNLRPRLYTWFAQGLAVEGKAVRGVHEAVEDGIGDCRIDDHLVPVIDGELTGHDRRAAAMAIGDDFEQVAALLRGQRCHAPVIEDQKLDTGEALEEAYIPSVAARQCKCVEQAWYAIIEHRSIITACLVCE